MPALALLGVAVLAATAADPSAPVARPSATGLTVAAAEAPAALPAPAPTPARRDASGEGLFDLLSVLDSDFDVGPWRLHGYIQYDAAAYLQDKAGPLETDFRRGPLGDTGARAADLDDGALLRRARLGAQGTFRQRFAYRAIFEFGQDQGTDLIEAWVSYNRRPYVFQIGAFPQPANMADATSADSTVFLERATPADFARSLGAGDGRLGMTLRRSSPKGMAALSLTGPVINETDDYSPRSALIGRTLQRVASKGDRNVYLGGSAIYVLATSRKSETGGRPPFPVRLEAAPEVKVDDTSLIDTGYISAKHARVLGLEFAAQQRNLLLQAEAFGFQVEREAGSRLSDPHFWGFYVQGTWQITGERRRYDAARGAFWFPAPARPVGSGGWGAFELGFRYSRMDLNYHPGQAGLPPPPDGVRGGDQQIFGLSLEWFPRGRFRMVVNLTHVKVDRLNPAGPSDPEPFGPAPMTPPVGVQIGQSLNIMAVRGRYGF